MRIQHSPEEQVALPQATNRTSSKTPENMSAPSSPSKAFKRTKSLQTSAWYMANLTTYLVEKKDGNGDFALIEAIMEPGNEPPPHVHSREDELYYLIEGEVDIYVGKEAFKVQAAECAFLPKLTPHAFVIRSSRIRLLLIITPGGLEEAFRSVASPAQSLDLPIGMPTYSTTDLKRTAQRFSEYGVRFLAPDEVDEQLPLYPNPLLREPLSAKQQ